MARWVGLSRQPNGLDARSQPGPTASLSDSQLRRLEALLVNGSKAHGWPNELWTAARVARLIERRFRIAYHPEHVRKILKRRLGWTSQKPRRQVRDLNPDEGLWAWAKYGRLANLAADDTGELRDWVVNELVEAKLRPDLLRGFVRQTGLPGVTLAA